MSEHCSGGCCHCHDHKNEGGEKRDIIKITVAAALFGLAIATTFVFSQLHPIARAAVFLVPYLIAAFDVLKSAAKGIVRGKFFSEGVLMCIASVGAFIIGEYPEAVFVMLFFDVGELFEHIASAKSRKSIKSLIDLRPDSITLIKNGSEVTASPKDAQIGDICLVTAGERVALDGVIIEGETSLDLSALTGESLPTQAGVGDRLLSGSINLSGTVRFRVESTFGNSTVSRILDLVENAGERKASSERFITKFSKIYTPAVVAAALLLAVIPSIITGEASKWIWRALMFLVVSCPCALVISVPLCYFGGLGAASKKGILIKGAEFLDTLTSLETVAFDKTGTLTSGRLSVTEICPVGISESELLQLAATAEYRSSHPIAIALKSACKEADTTKITEALELSAHGVKTVIDGKAVLAGSARLMQSEGIEFKPSDTLGTQVYVAADGRYLGHITLADTLKPDTAQAISSLNKMNIKTVMLTGDRTAVAQSTARELKISEFSAELLPDQKVAELERLSVDGITAFAGDGINDAPCLARADLSFAMGGIGSDAAIEAADIVVMNDSLTSIPTAIKLAHRTRKIALQSIVFSISVKLLVLLLSALGVTSMWFAAIADVGVMVVAVLNATRALKTE